MDISIIIPTNNINKYKVRSLELTLMSIYSQYIDKSFEVIVVENGKDERPIYFNKYENLIYSYKKCFGSISKARNHGANIAKGNILLFVDDDVILYESNLVEKITSLIDNNYSFACGVKRYWTHINWDYNKVNNELINNKYEYLKKISVLPKGFERESGYRSLQEVSFLGNFGCLSKYIFNKVKGFNEEYKVWGREDCDLMYRLLICENAKFVNCYSHGCVFHLNHPVIDKSKYLKDNEKIYSKLEKKYGIHIKWSHLFEIYESDNREVYKKININK